MNDEYRAKIRAAVEQLAEETGIPIAQVDADIDSPEAFNLLFEAAEVLDGEIIKMVLDSPEFGGAYAQTTGAFTYELGLELEQVEKLVSRDKALVALIIAFLRRI